MKGKAPTTRYEEVVPGKRAEAIGAMGAPYGGPTVAQMDPLQQEAMQKFTQYMGRGGPSGYLGTPMYQQARGLMGDVLGGKYLGAETPMMQYLTQQTYGKDVPEAQAKLRQAQALRGGFYTSRGMGEEADILSEAGRFLGGQRASEYQRELERQMGMIQPAMTLAQQEQAAPMMDIGTMMQMGEIPRGIEQKGYDIALADWQRAQAGLQQQIPWLGGQYTTTPGEPSAFEKWINPALQIGALAAAIPTGGLSLAAIPALQGMGQAFATGAPTGDFANITGAITPMVSAGMGGMFPTGGAGASIPQLAGGGTDLWAASSPLAGTPGGWGGVSPTAPSAGGWDWSKFFGAAPQYGGGLS